MNSENKKEISTKQLVVCGILLAISIVLLYLASVIPGMELTLMAAVGAIVFIVCANSTFRIGRIFYVASVLMALIIAPGKVIILPYIFCLGPYALIKYGVEKFCLKFDGEGVNNNATQKSSEDTIGKISRVDIRLTDDEDEYVPIEEIPREEIHEEIKKKKLLNTKKILIEYTLKIIGFAACIGICFLFVLFVMGLSPATVLLNGNIIGTESELFAKIGVGLTYAIIVIVAIAVFVLYDNIIRLINVVFGKYVR